MLARGCCSDALLGSRLEAMSKWSGEIRGGERVQGHERA